MNPKGKGMLIGEEVEFEVMFPPFINDVEWVDPETKKKKTFTSVKVLAIPLNHLDFFTPHLSKEYGNVSLQLPSSETILKQMEGAIRGDKFKITLIEFISMKDGQKRNTFTCEQLDIITDKDTQSSKVEDTQSTVESKDVSDTELPW